jgi:hemoglobin
MSDKTLYDRLGGYDAIAAFAENIIPRFRQDKHLARFWTHRSIDEVARETQTFINYICSTTGGPVFYTGRDMVTAHRGMRINNDDWDALLFHLDATFDHFGIGAQEREEMIAMINSVKSDIVEA